MSVQSGQSKDQIQGKTINGGNLHGNEEEGKEKEETLSRWCRFCETISRTRRVPHGLLRRTLEGLFHW
jgi:hypothetical protein